MYFLFYWCTSSSFHTNILLLLWITTFLCSRLFLAKDNWRILLSFWLYRSCVLMLMMSLLCDTLFRVRWCNWWNNRAFIVQRSYCSQSWNVCTIMQKYRIVNYIDVIFLCYWFLCTKIVCFYEKDIVWFLIHFEYQLMASQLSWSLEADFCKFVLGIFLMCVFDIPE